MHIWKFEYKIYKKRETKWKAKGNKKKIKETETSRRIFHFPFRFFIHQFSRKQLFDPLRASEHAVWVCAVSLCELMLCVWLLCVCYVCDCCVCGCCACPCKCVFFMKLPTRRSELAANCVEQHREQSQIFPLRVRECVCVCVCECGLVLCVCVCLLILKQTHTHTPSNCSCSSWNCHCDVRKARMISEPKSRTQLIDGRKSSLWFFSPFLALFSLKCKTFE